MSEKWSESMRDLVLAFGGDLRGSENREAWLHRIARDLGESYRLVRAAWHREIKNEEHRLAWKLKNLLEARAQKEEAAAKDEYRELQERLAKLERLFLENSSHVRGAPTDEVREPLRRGGGLDRA